MSVNSLVFLSFSL